MEVASQGSLDNNDVSLRPGQITGAMSTDRESSPRDVLGHESGSSTGKICNGGTLTNFSGKTRVYTVKTIKSGAEHGFVDKIDDRFQIIPGYADLVKIVDGIHRDVYPDRARRNPELTTTRILRSLSNPRTILELLLYEGAPVGYGIFPRFDFGMYSSRAILAKHVREGGGTYMLEKAIILQRKEGERWNRPLHDGFLMTQRWESIRSLEKLKEKGLVGKIQPIDEPFDAEGAALLFKAHSQVFVSSKGIELTGRSRGELSEVGYNENLDPPKEGTRASETFKKIVNRPPEGAGVNVFVGDVLYVRFTIPEL